MLGCSWIWSVKWHPCGPLSLSPSVSLPLNSAFLCVGSVLRKAHHMRWKDGTSSFTTYSPCSVTPAQRLASSSTVSASPSSLSHWPALSHVPIAGQITWPGRRNMGPLGPSMKAWWFLRCFPQGTRAGRNKRRDDPCTREQKMENATPL